MTPIAKLEALAAEEPETIGVLPERRSAYDLYVELKSELAIFKTEHASLKSRVLV